MVVPAYRTPELFLRQMIDSLEAQTYEDWELCIANGSPEDQSMRKVLEEYSSRDRRVRWQELTEIKGLQRTPMLHLPWQGRICGASGS